MTEEVKVIRVYESFVLGKCRCSCNIDIKLRNVSGYLSKTSKGHGVKNKAHNWMPKGKDHYKYREKVIDNDGYILIKVKNHPFANWNNRVREHRLVYERYYNCILLPYTQIHHIDGNVQNNSIENLQPTYNGIHRQKYHLLDRIGWTCAICQTMKCRKWRYIDFIHEIIRICANCHRNVYYNSSHRKELYYKTGY